MTRVVLLAVALAGGVLLVTVILKPEPPPCAAFDLERFRADYARCPR